MSRGPYRQHDPAAVFAAIVEHMKATNGAAPTRRQLAERFNTSTSVVTAILGKLEAAGHIRRINGDARGIQVVGAEWTYTGPMSVDTEEYVGVQVAGAEPMP
jgi:DNA-binding GntR family transcriptional regulator